MAEPQVCPVPVPAMSIVPISYAFASDLDIGHSEAYQMFDENPHGEWPHSQTVSSSDAKESLNECVRHDKDGEVKVSATSIIVESVFNTGNDHKAYDVHSNAPFIGPPIVVDVVADQSAGLHFQLAQVLGGTTRCAEIDFSVPIQPTESADKEGEWLENIANIVFDKSLELNETKQQCHFANMALIETATYVSSEILSAHFDEPTGNEGVALLLIHTQELAMNLTHVLQICNWFDTGQHASNEVVLTLLIAKRRKSCHLYSAHRKGARDNGLLICSYVDSCFAAGLVLRACFNMVELCVSLLLRQVQLIGYPSGFQALDVAAASSRCKSVSWRVALVNSLQLRHFPIKFNGHKGFIISHLLLLRLASDNVIDSTSARNERHDFIAPGANFFITIRATVEDLCEWDPGISFKSKSLTGTAQAFQGVLVGQTGVNLRAQVTFAVIVIFDPGGGPLDAPILEYSDGVLEAILKAIANLSINNVPLSVDNVDFQATIHYLTKSEYGLSLYGVYFLVESRCEIRVNGAFLFESHSADSHKFTGVPGDLLRNMKWDCNIDSTACVGILEPLELQLEVKGVFESIVEHFSTLNRKSNRQLITIDLRVVIRDNKGCQGNFASRSMSCYGPQDTAMYFRCIGFTKDTSALIMLKAKWDTEQSAYDSAKSLWPSLSKIIIPSIEISEALPFVALLVMLVAQPALVMEGVLVFISTCDRDELATATYIPRFVLVIDVASMTIITRTIVATYGNASFVFECKSTCQLVAFTHVDVYIATFSLLLFFVEGFVDSNLEDKVLIEDGGIVMNQPQPSKDSNKDVTKIVVGLRRAIGPRTSNWARFIWDPG
ncbi:hypothetical protein A4A49_04114 [Nicotiana attenuata]|uniref:Uncharacterized protein n=1 Tax=Nicotiana attenuata TaxID=49451 RepID=A0A1J6HUB6_NICAT|nr:hypothetical protein A4A49_04114 [Nicotiana attenuata]